LALVGYRLAHLPFTADELGSQLSAGIGPHLSGLSRVGLAIPKACRHRHSTPEKPKSRPALSPEHTRNDSDTPTRTPTNTNEHQQGHDRAPRPLRCWALPFRLTRACRPLPGISRPQAHRLAGDGQRRCFQTRTQRGARRRGHDPARKAPASPAPPVCCFQRHTQQSGKSTRLGLPRWKLALNLPSIGGAEVEF